MKLDLTTIVIGSFLVGGGVIAYFKFIKPATGYSYPAPFPGAPPGTAPGIATPPVVPMTALPPPAPASVPKPPTNMPLKAALARRFRSRRYY